MSTGLNCELLETNDGWFYILEHGNAPKEAWDWMDYATAYGPFTSKAAATRHLGTNHANPGGWGVAHYDGPAASIEGQLGVLLAKATPAYSRTPRRLNQ